MKQFMLLSVALIALFIANYSKAADEIISYKNSRGSLLELHFSDTHKLSGTFATAVATKDCQHAIGYKQPILGYVNGSAITFIVNYPRCGAVLTLIGHINKDKSTIEAMGLLAQQDSLFDKGAGTESITHDVFIKEN